MMMGAPKCLTYLLPRQMVTAISNLLKMNFAIYAGSLVVMAQFKSYKGPIKYLWQLIFQYDLVGMENQSHCGATIC